MKESIFTNKMRAFLVISYLVSINKLPTKKKWECGQFISNE